MNYMFVSDQSCCSMKFDGNIVLHLSIVYLYLSNKEVKTLKKFVIFIECVWWMILLCSVIDQLNAMFSLFVGV